MAEEDSVTHNENKFTLTDPTISRNPAFLEYSVNKDILDMVHTFVPLAMRGRGVAGVLVRNGLKFAARKNLRVRTSCWYAEEYVKKNGSFGTKIVK